MPKFFKGLDKKCKKILKNVEHEIRDAIKHGKVEVTVSAGNEKIIECAKDSSGTSCKFGPQ